MARPSSPRPVKPLKPDTTPPTPDVTLDLGYLRHPRISNQSYDGLAATRATMVAMTAVVLAYCRTDTPSPGATFEGVASSQARVALDTLLWGRAASAALGVCSCIYLCVDERGLNVLTMKSAKNGGGTRLVNLRKGGRFTTFTVQSWAMLSLYFTLAALCTLAKRSGATAADIPTFVPELVACLYEIVCPTAALVFIAVTFVLTPLAYSNGAMDLFKPTPLLFHNANVLMVAAEVYSNNEALQFRPEHLSLCAVNGLFYLVFAQYWYSRTGVFYYFFIDHTGPIGLPGIVALLVVISSSYLTFVAYAN